MTNPVPVSFRVISVLALLWNLVGVAMFFLQTGMSAEQIAGFDPALYMLKASAYTNIEADAAITTAVNALVAGAPGALDTLQELSAALGIDAAFGGTVTTALTNPLRIDAAQHHER